MDLNEFNNYYLNELLHKLSSENKSFILLSDFNIDLVKYDNHHPINEFLDSYFLFLDLHITQQTIIRNSSKTLIDIFSNTFIENIMSGNLTAAISDHLPKFIILPNIFSAKYPTSNESNFYEREWSNFVQGNVILDYFSVDWDSLINDDNKYM